MIKDTTLVNATYLPEKGERALTIGMTGSGKTAFSLWLMQMLPQTPVVIYDTKIEPKFDKMPNSAVAESWEKVRELADNLSVDYIIFRPNHYDLSEPDILDGYLERHYFDLNHVPAYIDELLSFHRGGRAGPGLIALLTRGRSKGITTLMSTQRPSWISNFALTETDKFYLFFNSFEDDQKKLNKVIPGFKLLKPAKDYGHWFYDVRRQVTKAMGKIKLDARFNTGYSDNLQAVTTTDSDGKAPTASHTRLPWIE